MNTKFQLLRHVPAEPSRNHSVYVVGHWQMHSRLVLSVQLFLWPASALGFCTGVLHWGAAEAKSKGLLCREPKAMTGSCFKAWSGSEYSFSCFVYCQQFCLLQSLFRICPIKISILFNRLCVWILIFPSFNKKYNSFNNYSPVLINATVIWTNVDVTWHVRWFQFISSVCFMIGFSSGFCLLALCSMTVFLLLACEH